jgi:superfamily II DNA or RNA helicase
MLIDACFGKPIIDINASFLIKEGILVKPSIYFVPVSSHATGTYPTVYSEGIVKNDERNSLIAKIASQMVKNGRQVLILVKLIEHGDLLESMIPDSFFIHGSHTAKQRSEWLDKMRRREAPITIATSIFDEGVDVKPLDGLILAGSGKSQTRALQRIGRVIRAYSDDKTGFVKKDAFIVDFMDDMKYMRNHSKKRKLMYETEPEFIIKVYQ